MLKSTATLFVLAVMASPAAQAQSRPQAQKTETTPPSLYAVSAAGLATFNTCLTPEISKLVFALNAEFVKQGL